MQEIETTTTRIGAPLITATKTPQPGSVFVALHVDVDVDEETPNLASLHANNTYRLEER